MKRVLAILMALVMLFSMVACTGTGNDGDVEKKTYEFTTGYDETKYNEPGTFPIFKEKQTISVMLPDNEYVEDWDTNTQTLMYEEQLNADLVLTVMPSGEYKTKINLMAASGGEEYTDVILGSFASAMVIQLADSEMLTPITEYMYNTDITYYTQDALDRMGFDFYPLITMPDGEIYAIPSVTDSVSNCNNAKMWVYKPWFDAAGVDIKDIHTTEDFKNAFLTVVKNDPNGNGKNDEVGVTSYATSLKWFEYLMNAFIYAGGDDYMYVKDGTLGLAYQREEWKEGLKFMKELYDLGLIDPLTFSQDSASYKSMLNYTDTIVTAFSSLGADYIAEDDIRRVQYECIAPLNSAWNDGKPLSSYNLPSATAAFLVSCNVTDAENAVRFGDLMMKKENSIHKRWGEKGVDWLEPGENDKSMYDVLGYPATLIEVLPYSTVQNKHWHGTAAGANAKEISAGVVWSGNPLDHNIKIAEGQLLYENTAPAEDFQDLIYTLEENEIIAEATANLKTYVNEMTAKFITGTIDIDEGWEAFQNQTKTMNSEEVLRLAQTAFDRMYK